MARSSKPCSRNRSISAAVESLGSRLSFSAKAHSARSTGEEGGAAPVGGDQMHEPVCFAVIFNAEIRGDLGTEGRGRGRVFSTRNGLRPKPPRRASLAVPG